MKCPNCGKELPEHETSDFSSCDGIPDICRYCGYDFMIGRVTEGGIELAKTKGNYEEKMVMSIEDKGKLLKEWNELYDSIFPPLKKKYDEISKVFVDWNVGKINTETAIKRVNALVVSYEKEGK